MRWMTNFYDSMFKLTPTSAIGIHPTKSWLSRLLNFNAPCDFWLFPKLRGCRYKTIEEMKEAVTKVIDTLTQEDFHGAFQKLLERYNKCIAAGGDYFEEDKCFMCVLSIKVPIRKKSGNLFNDPRIYFKLWNALVKQRLLFKIISLLLLNIFMLHILIREIDIFIPVRKTSIMSIRIPRLLSSGTKIFYYLWV